MRRATHGLHKNIFSAILHDNGRHVPQRDRADSACAAYNVSTAMTQDQPASDFDGAWKYALEQQFDTFLAFFFPQAHAAIDWQRPVVVRDNELQQVAPEDQAGKQRVDRLVEVYRLDGEPALVLVHIEIQAQRDSAFASRMFRYVRDCSTGRGCRWRAWPSWATRLPIGGRIGLGTRFGAANSGCASRW